jgi:hypothetical protein
MKKQYDYYECRWPSYEIILYHDGIKVDSERISLHKLYERLEQLEAKGYTFGYTEEDVEKARKKYEYMYENRIVKEGN